MTGLHNWHCAPCAVRATAEETVSQFRQAAFLARYELRMKKDLRSNVPSQNIHTSTSSGILLELLDPWRWNRYVYPKTSLININQRRATPHKSENLNYAVAYAHNLANNIAIGYMYTQILAWRWHVMFRWETKILSWGCLTLPFKYLLWCFKNASGQIYSSVIA